MRYIRSLLVGDLLLAELLQAARDDLHAIRIEGYLRRFYVVSLLHDDSDYDAMERFCSLRVLR